MTLSQAGRNAAAIVVLIVVVSYLVVAITSGEPGTRPDSSLEQRAEGVRAAEGPDREAPRLRGSTATLLAGIVAVIGTLLGALLGLFGDRHLRYRGTIQCKFSGRHLTAVIQDMHRPEQLNYEPFRKDLLERMMVLARTKNCNYGVSAKLFNEMEVSTGLRDLQVVFVDDAGAPVLTGRTQLSDSRGFAMDPDVFNLPSRQWANAQLHGNIEPKDFQTLAKSTRVELRAYLPRDELFRREIGRIQD